MARKVTVIGAGNVGATTAQRIFERELADVALVDIVPGLAAGKALDMMESAPVVRTDRCIVGSDDYEIVSGSDVIVITAGLPRKPGMSREDLLQKNAEIVRSVVEKCAKQAPDAIMIVVSNPLDVMTHLAYRVSGFDKRRVMGMAGVLDSARFQYFIADALNVSVKDVSAVVLGGHGDQMVPLPRYSTVCGVPVTELLPADKIDELIERTRRAGAEIVELLKTGSAYYAPSAAILSMVESILLDAKRVQPVSVLLDGEYGIHGVFVGVPVSLGKGGVERVIELELTDSELELLHKSVESVRENIKKLES